MHVLGTMPGLSEIDLVKSKCGIRHDDGGKSKIVRGVCPVFDRLIGAHTNNDQVSGAACMQKGLARSEWMHRRVVFKASFISCKPRQPLPLACAHWLPATSSIANRPTDAPCEHIRQKKGTTQGALFIGL